MKDKGERSRVELQTERQHSKQTIVAYVTLLKVMSVCKKIKIRVEVKVIRKITE